jgi:predicted nucleic acid-binding protein
MDVVIDTDILSTFVKAGKAGLLQKLFPKSKIILCPAVRFEISRAVKLGIVDSIPASFSRIELTRSEKILAKEVGERTTLAAAEIEFLAVAKNRDCLLLSNDRRAGNEALSLAVDHLSLPLLLRELLKSDVLSKTEVVKFVDEIERKDRIVIRNKELILK